MKKMFYLTLGLATVGLGLTQTIHSENLEHGTKYLEGLNEEWDEFDFLNQMEPISSPLTRATPSEIIAILEALGVTQLLQEEFFLRTNDLNKRPLVDLPIFEVRRCDNCSEWIIGSHLFFNQTNRMNFTRKSTRLCSYLGLAQPTLIGAIENLIDQIAPLAGDQFDLNIPLIFNALSNFGVQERRAGFMFHALHQTDCSQMLILLPFFYQERNFIATDRERDILESQFGRADPTEQERFQNNHLISDKFGFGDLRFEAEANVANWCDSIIRLGTVITLPTAWAWKKGLRGNTFPRKSCQPSLTGFLNLLEKIDDLAQIEQAAFCFFSNFLLGSLDRLAAAVLDDELGNRHHLRLGILARTFTPLSSLLSWSGAECWSFYSRTSFEYVFPSREPRFFIKRNLPDEFTLRDFSNDAQAQENLCFLAQAFVNKFYPIALPTLVQPGVIFRWTSRFCYDGCRWGVNVGTDLWVQSKESFIDICALPSQRPRIDRPAAQKPFGYQTKLYGGILYKHCTDCHDWVVSFNGDGTIASAGMPKDFTLSFNFETYF